jgi:2-keto-4-pentenoate hydratase/2-oxohepta-3-ene-1,7-dioic acid hydratase in catechol pathway
MRLITFTPKSAPTAAPRLGALLPGDRSVLNFAVSVDASADVPLIAWLDLDDEWLPKARQIHDALAKNAQRVETLPRGSVLPAADVVIGPPVPRPGKIICIGLNYKDHAAESNMPVPTSPITFSKYGTSVTGPGSPIVLPNGSTQVDYEAELAVVIGKVGRRIAEGDAWSHVAGISCYNDGSVRDWQLLTGQWSPGKNFPATGAFGPWLVTPDEVDPARALRLSLRLNGETMQDTTTDLMMFPIPKLIAFVSTWTTLEVGDVIVTGTPGGVGLRRDPQVWMKDGDTVEVELEGVGVLRNPIVKEGAAP